MGLNLYQINNLKEKTDYLINHLNKVFQKLPEFIKTIIEHLFNNQEIEKATKHINQEMEELAENFYTDKKDKEKDDGLSL